jgi:hypothetical protein
MVGNVLPHPKRGPMIEAKIERDLVDSPEADVLQNAIFKAVTAYVDFLLDNDVIWDDSSNLDGIPRMKAQALVVTADFGIDPTGAIDITLKGGALDRVYGDGVNPDPNGLDANPHRIADPPAKIERRASELTTREEGARDGASLL